MLKSPPLSGVGKPLLGRSLWVIITNAISHGLTMEKLRLLLCFYITFICVYLPGTEGEGRKKVDVYVAGFFPVGKGPKQALGKGVMPALNLAVRHVNEHPTILRNYKLHVVWNDTKCDTAIGTKAFFELMYNSPRKVMLFGAACTPVTDTIAKAARHWHIAQLSYAETHPMFSAIEYPNFFRMAPNDKEFNMPRIHLLRHYNWTRVGTLFQNEPRHALAHNHLVSLLDKMGDFEIVDTQSFADDLGDQMTKLSDQDVRIILGFFDEKWARKIFCEAYKKKMFGKNFQWIITGMYRKRWWELKGNEDDETGSGEDSIEGDRTRMDSPELESEEGLCMVEDIMKALEGCIMIDLLPLATSDIKTVSGKNITQYKVAYNNMRKEAYSRFHGYTYDGVWTMALAIQAVGTELHKRNYKDRTNTTFKDFVYRDPRWEELFTSALSQVQFEGVTGHVQFTKDNTRKAYILLKQFQDGSEVKIGEYDGFNDNLNLRSKGHAIYWPGGHPPLDRTVKIVEKSSVNVRIYAILVTLASVGIVAATIFLIINIHFRNQRYIKMSSPYLNNLIIIGCIFTYTSVIILGLDSGLTSEKSFPVICTSRAWVLMSGFTLAFGSMFSKTWRVHSIFTDVQMNKKVIKDYQLYMVVFVLLILDIAIMITWQIVDPFRRETKLMQPYMRGDIQVIPENEYCMSNHMSIFVGCIYAWKGLLMIFGCFLAWETRHVSLPALNDSKYIGMSVYNVVIMCVIGVPISYILSEQQDAMYLIISIFILFCTTGTLCLVFVPKLIELRRNPQGTIDKRMIRPTLKPPKRNDSDSDVSDLHDQIKKAEGDRTNFIKRLKMKEGELKALLEQYAEECDEVETPTDHKMASTSQAAAPETIESHPRDRFKFDGVYPAGYSEVHADCGSTKCVSPIDDLRKLKMAESNSTTTNILHHNNNYEQHNNHHQGTTTPLQQKHHSVPIERSTSRRSQRLSSSPETATPREVPKSVSFRLDSGNVSPLQATPIIIHNTLSISPQPSAQYNSSSAYHRPTAVSAQQYQRNTNYHPYNDSSNVVVSHSSYTSASVAVAQPQRGRSTQTQDINALEREGAAYGGYGGIYVHDYGGPMASSLRGGGSNLISGRMRYPHEGPVILQTTNYPTTDHQFITSDVSPHRHSMLEGRTDGYDYTELPRRSSLKKTIGFCKAEGPLNNESRSDSRNSSIYNRKSADLTIINNTVAASSQVSYKNINAHANLSATSSLVEEGALLLPHPSNVVRRGSEPPRPYVGDRINANNRSFDDFANSEVLLGGRSAINPRCFSSGSRREDEGAGGPRSTISRANLRRDSFGEVASSRRSPSQDSLEMSRTRSPPPSEIRRTDEDIWSSSRHHSLSQDSLHRQEFEGVGRTISQESIGTMSSRGSVAGSIFSMTSARSDIPPGHKVWHSREGNRQTSIRKSNNDTVQDSFLNGDLGETAASIDDIAHQVVKDGFREPTSLHRASSEPHYSFDSMDIPDGPLNFNHPGLISQHADYNHSYEPETRTLGRHRNHTSSTHAYAGMIQGGVGNSHTLRGRSHSIGRTRATTSSVAAAIAATRNKNRSDNALDHDITILPIFQKLLSERQRSFNAGHNRDYTMSSCPNITIKCDIVEYL